MRNVKAHLEKMRTRFRNWKEIFFVSCTEERYTKELRQVTLTIIENSLKFRIQKVIELAKNQPLAKQSVKKSYIAIHKFIEENLKVTYREVQMSLEIKISWIFLIIY